MTTSHQAAHQQRRRYRGQCAYNGCPEMTGETARCPIHAARHAARMARVRATAKALATKCACGSNLDVGRCPYYKSGRHIVLPPPKKIPKPRRKKGDPV